MWGRDLSIEDLLTLSKHGSFRVSTHEGRTIIRVERPGEPVELITCVSVAHANQVRLRLSDEGLRGHFEGAC